MFVGILLRDLVWSLNACAIARFSKSACARAAKKLQGATLSAGNCFEPP